MIAAVDTNVLLDILIPNAQFCEKSKKLLDTAHEQGSLIISEIVYAELASQFEKGQVFEKFLNDTDTAPLLLLQRS